MAGLETVEKVAATVDVNGDHSDGVVDEVSTDQYEPQIERVKATLDSYVPPEMADQKELLDEVATRIVDIILVEAPEAHKRAVAESKEVLQTSHESAGTNTSIEPPIEIARHMISSFLVEQYFRGLQLNSVFREVDARLRIDIDKARDLGSRMELLEIHSRTFVPALHEAIGDAKDTIASNLLSTLHHDMRSPNTIFLGYLQFLQDPVIPPETQVLAQNEINRAATKAVTLDEITPSVVLHLQQQVGAEIENYEVPRAIRTRNSRLEQLIDRITIGYSSDIELKSPDGLLDKSLPVLAVNFALIQLVSNAHKYGEKGARILIEVIENENFVGIVVTNRLLHQGSYKYPGTSKLLAQRPTSEIGNSNSDSWRLGLATALRFTRMSGGDIVPVDDGNDPPDTLSMCIVFPNNKSK